MFLYTALGDSITAGELATSPARAYPSLVVDMLHRRGVAATGEVLAVPGWTSAELSAAVFENPPVHLAAAHAISIWVGGDNVAAAGLALLNGAPAHIVDAAVRQYEADLMRLVAWIRRISRACIVLCTQYNPFPNSVAATAAIAALNAATARVAAHQGAAIAPVHAWFARREAQLIAGYQTGRVHDVFTRSLLPVHPNDTGHRVIARGLYAYMRR